MDRALSRGPESRAPKSPNYPQQKPPFVRKILAPIKNKIGTPPPQTANTPPLLWTWRSSCRKNSFFQASIKMAQPFPAPELRTNNFTDTRIFLIKGDTAKGIMGKNALKVKKKRKLRVFSRCFQGVSGNSFQGVFRLFSGSFPYPL